MTPEEQAALDAQAATAPAPEVNPVEEIVVGILDLWAQLPQEASIELLAMLNAQFNAEATAAEEAAAPAAADERAAMMADKVF